MRTGIVHTVGLVCAISGVVGFVGSVTNIPDFVSVFPDEHLHHWLPGTILMMALSAVIIVFGLIALARRDTPVRTLEIMTGCIGVGFWSAIGALLLISYQQIPYLPAESAFYDHVPILFFVFMGPVQMFAWDEGLFRLGIGGAIALVSGAPLCAAVWLLFGRRKLLIDVALGVVCLAYLIDSSTGAIESIPWNPEFAEPLAPITRTCDSIYYGLPLGFYAQHLAVCALLLVTALLLFRRSLARTGARPDALSTAP